MSEVARAAGVSLQTVSRVLNHAKNVRKETRERVLLAVDQVGYRPSFAGRSLRRGSYRTIGFCTPDIGMSNLVALRGVTAAASERGYALTLVQLDAPLKEISRQLVALPVDGIIVNIDRRPPDFDTFVPFPGIGTVLISGFEQPYCTTVDIDHEQVAELAVGYLASRGHRHIRFVGGPKDSTRAELREVGWRNALLRRGLPLSEPLRVDWTADGGYEAGQVIAQDPEMTAVFAANDQIAFGVGCGLEDHGMFTPEDVSIVGVDDSLGDIAPHNIITSVSIDNEWLWETAFECAVAQTADVRAIRTKGTLVERGSVSDLR